MLDLTKFKGRQGQSKGNLIKWEIPRKGKKTFFIKSGRIQTRDYPNHFGIEPIVEVLCYEFAKVLEIPCVNQKLEVALINHNGNKVFIFVNVSEDFKNGNEFFEFGNSLPLTRTPVRRDFQSIASTFKCHRELLTMLLFDTLILNEDRHDFNFGFIVEVKTKEIKFSPLYDNGYALLYDDVRGLLSSFEKSSKFCNCNSFYLSFHNCDSLIRKYKENNSLRDLCNINLRDRTVENVIKKVYEIYRTLSMTYEVNNIPLSEQWFRAIYDFLIWRLNYVRNL